MHREVAPGINDNLCDDKNGRDVNKTRNFGLNHNSTSQPTSEIGHVSNYWMKQRLSLPCAEEDDDDIDYSDIIDNTDSNSASSNELSVNRFWLNNDNLKQPLDDNKKDKDKDENNEDSNSVCVSSSSNEVSVNNFWLNDREKDIDSVRPYHSHKSSQEEGETGEIRENLDDHDFNYRNHHNNNNNHHHQHEQEGGDSNSVDSIKSFKSFNSINSTDIYNASEIDYNVDDFDCEENDHFSYKYKYAYDERESDSGGEYNEDSNSTSPYNATHSISNASSYNNNSSNGLSHNNNNNNNNNNNCLDNYDSLGNRNYSVGSYRSSGRNSGSSSGNSDCTACEKEIQETQNNDTQNKDQLQLNITINNGNDDGGGGLTEQFKGLVAKRYVFKFISFGLVLG